MSNSPKRRPSSSVKVRNAQASASGGSALWWMVGVGALIVVVALVVAIAATRSSGDTSSGLAFGTVTVTGENLAEMPEDGSADPALGQAAPEVVGQRFDGSPITIAAAGQPKVVMLLAHWCPHCQREVPLLAAELNANGLPTDVELVSIATGTDEKADNYPPAAWLAEEDWPVPTLVDDGQGSAARAYGLSGFPMFVVIDAQGNVVDRQSGEKTVEQFNAMVESARTGTRAGG